MGQRSDELTGASGGYDENNPLYAHGQRVPASDDAIIDNEERIRTRQSMSSDTADNAAEDAADNAADSVSAQVGVEAEKMETAESTEDGDPAEIREDIEDTRARMSTTIDAIQEKLSPHNLMEQAKETAREATIGRVQDMASNVAESARETGSTLMDTVRQNPVPVALTGIGLGWLFLSARRASVRRQQGRAYGYGYRYGGDGGYDDRVRGGYGGQMRAYQQSHQSPPDKSRMGQMAKQVQDTAGNAAGNVSDKVQDAASTVADKAGDMADRVQGQARQTRGWLEQTWNDNPLVVSGASLVLGAIVGLSIPETPMEDQLMGETRDNLVQKAQGVAEDTVEKAQQAATKATDQMANQQSKGGNGGNQPGRKQ
jgi:hypothetical protein